MRSRPFAQVDVFSSTPYLGNPLAVILDATDLTGSDMQRIARWTNLSETTFVLPPTPAGRDAGADYRVRIFTPDGELPFAGHPTLGTAHAWLEHVAGNGGTPQRPGQRPDLIVQECGAGLVRIHRDTGGTPDARDAQHTQDTRDFQDTRHTVGVLAFEAPETTRSGPVSEEDLARFCAVLGVDRDSVVDHQWVVNGPRWAAVMLASAQQVLDLRPDLSALGDLELGVVGPYPPDAPCAWELRAFTPDCGEDPVTGSFNASVGQWLLRTGRMPAPYTAAQGTVLGRTGRERVTPTADRGNVLVGGAVTTLVTGSLRV